MHQPDGTLAPRCPSATFLIWHQPDGALAPSCPSSATILNWQVLKVNAARGAIYRYLGANALAPRSSGRGLLVGASEVLLLAQSPKE